MKNLAAILVAIAITVTACGGSATQGPPPFAPDGAERVDTAQGTVWRTPDGVVYGDCATVEAFITTLDLDPGKVCN